jgi:hypothetical protein
MTDESKKRGKYRKKKDLPYPELRSDHIKNRPKGQLVSSISRDVESELKNEDHWKGEGFDNRSEWLEHHLRDILDMS